MPSFLAQTKGLIFPNTVESLSIIWDIFIHIKLLYATPPPFKILKSYINFFIEIFKWNYYKISVLEILCSCDFIQNGGLAKFSTP